MTDNPTKTLIQRLEEYFEAKRAEGYQIVDRDSCLKLRKMAMQDLKLKDGNWTYTGKALEKVMEKRGIKVPDDMQAKLFKEMKIKIIKSETPEPQVTPAESPHGTLPRAESTLPSQPSLGQTGQLREVSLQPRVTEDQADSYEMGLKFGFRTLMRTYAKLGFIEVEEIQVKEKMTLTDYTDETDELASAWADYCLRHNVHLPKLFELFILAFTSAVVLGSPIVSQMGKRIKKKKEAEAVKELGKNIEKDEEKDSEK